MSLIKTALHLASPAADRAKLSILIFHRVFPQPDPLFPYDTDARQFDRIVGWVKRWFNVLPLDVAVARLQAGTLPARAAVLSFDDGYADNLEVALPILKRHGLCASFFIATGYLDGGRMWNDTVIEAIRSAKKATAIDLRGLVASDGEEWTPLAIGSIEEKRAAIARILPCIKHLPQGERAAAAEAIAGQCAGALPETLMMTSPQVVAMRDAGMIVGAHTVSHPILATLGADESRAEIAASKRHLESLLGEAVRFFAYPNGKPTHDYQRKDVAIVRELGFAAALSTAAGVADRNTDLHQLPRFTPWDLERNAFGKRLIRNMLLNARSRHQQSAGD